MADRPYKVENTGRQVVKAPYAQSGGKGKTTVHSGSDLRDKGGKN